MRRILLIAALVVGMAVVASVELLSGFHALDRSGVVVVWGVILLGAMVGLTKTGTLA